MGKYKTIEVVDTTCRENETPRGSLKGVGGRPSKLTPEIHKRFVAFVRRGLTYKLAAQGCGVSYKAYSEWINKGEERPGSKYELFRNDVKSAEADLSQQLVDCIANAAQDPKHWQAAAWLLERRYKSNFGRQLIAEMPNRELQTDQGQKVTDLEKWNKARALYNMPGMGEDEYKEHMRRGADRKIKSNAEVGEAHPEN